MRGAFIAALTELAERDPRVMLLTADLGFMVFEPFAERFPSQFLNVGVAEQNMIGMATGLAEAGCVPYCYSIVTFAALRTYEFIRNGPILHQLPVRIVGVGGGFEYGPAGPTHHGLEDVGVMRLQPGLTVIAPADGGQTRSAILSTVDAPGPIFFRLGKNDRQTVPGLDGRFALDEVQRVREGGDVLLLAMGGIASEAAAAADQAGCAMAVVPVLNPAPAEALARLLAQYRAVITVEAHYISGGLGSLAAEVIAERGLGCRLIRCGVRETPDGATGSQAWLEHRHGLTAAHLLHTVRGAQAALAGNVR